MGHARFGPRTEIWRFVGRRMARKVSAPSRASLISEPDDGIEWRSELVAHSRQKICFRPIGRLRRGLRLGERNLMGFFLGYIEDHQQEAAIAQTLFADLFPATVVQSALHHWARILVLVEASRYISLCLVRAEVEAAT